ncbi:MAG: DUF120 domain-containing protein [Ferroplasma sp.]
MDYNLYNTIKVIKKIAGSSNTAKISSNELATIMNVSQQTASRFIIELAAQNYIERRLQGRRQKITILDSALDLLYGELNELNSILEMKQNFELIGNVTGGMGEGKYYISQQPYMDQFKSKMGIVPYPGTLNIKIKPELENVLRRIRSASGIHIDGFSNNERTFGGVKCFKGKIDGISAFLIFPERSSYTDIVEIISEYFLREKMRLSNGDELSIHVSIDR